MRNETWRTVVVALLPVAVMTASCEKEPAGDTGALAKEVRDLEARLAALEKRDLAAEIDQLKSRAAQAPSVDEARARQIAAREAEGAVERAVADLRGEMKKLRAAKVADRPAGKRGGREDALAGADRRKPKPPAGDLAAKQKAGAEKRVSKKAEMIGKKAGLDAGKVESLRAILAERETANFEIRRQAKAKEIEGKQAREKMADAKRNYDDAIGRFLDGLPEDQRAGAEKILKPQKRQREKKERPAGGAPERKKGERKKGKKTDEREEARPVAW